jgi:nucleoside-diphosphate-sugar epimerase
MAEIMIRVSPQPNLPRPILLLGGSGRLGQALSHTASSRGRSVTLLRTHDLDMAGLIPLMGRIGGGAGLDLVLANGLTDPALDPAVLRQANADLPLEVARLALLQPETRVLTMGTVLEHFPDLARNNAYIASKRVLAEGVAALAAETGPGRLAHLRIHTLYGGLPHPHMFLGQLLAALAAGRPFAMSHGTQLREYHHVEDVGSSIVALLDRMPDEAVLTLSHGRPVRLRDLAGAIFAAFGRSDLLRIGEVGADGAEDLIGAFPRSPDWLLGPVRDPVAGVLAWAAEILGRQPGLVPQQ